MSASPEPDLERALARLADLYRRKARPGRREARDLLIPLGELLLEDDARGAALLPRVRDEVGRAGKAWGEAVASELALACAEHIHSVDPRYLALPNYDLEYTLGARRRLRARLAAAAALGHPAPPTLLRGVERADALLDDSLSRRETRKNEGGSRST